jgi:hypothetical protein
MILQSLTKSSPSIPDSRPDVRVKSLCISATLSPAARRDPLFAFQTIFETVTKIAALGVSLISASQAEIFLPEDAFDQASSLLSKSCHLTTMPQLSVKDLRRRAASYNRGYFLPLRRFSLHGFATADQKQILEIAEASLPNLPIGRRAEVQQAIRKDRRWILGEGN